MAPLAYLKKALDFKLTEWQALSDADKEWFKNAAIVEMKALGIEPKLAA